MEPVKSIQNGGLKRKFPNRSKRYSPDFKLRAVKMFLEESVAAALIGQECGIYTTTLRRWVRAYRSQGEAGLSSTSGGKGRSLPSPVRQKILELKQGNPLFGIKRISQVLRRAFFLSASPETVRKTLHESSLIKPPRKKRQRNICPAPVFRTVNAESDVADGHFHVSSWWAVCLPYRLYRRLLPLPDGP